MWRMATVAAALGAVMVVGGCAANGDMSGQAAMRDHGMSGGMHDKDAMSGTSMTSDKAMDSRTGGMQDHGMSCASGMDSGSMMKDGGATYTK